MNPEQDRPDHIRIVYDRAGRTGPNRHAVRTSMEADVCSWLFAHGIAHLHAGEVFTVRLGARHQPAVYVPDIILHDSLPDGRRVLIETHQSHVPKEGGSRLLAAFRREHGGKFLLIIIARPQELRNLDPGSYDLVTDPADLAELLTVLPVPR